MDELRWVGRLGMGYQLTHALLFVALGLPQHLYELLPITVLIIFAIFVMARLAQVRNSPSCVPAAWGPGEH